MVLFAILMDNSSISSNSGLFYVYGILFNITRLLAPFPAYEFHLNSFQKKQKKIFIKKKTPI